MKPIKLLLLCFFLPLIFHGQHTLTGLWTGALTNDSGAVRKDQSFEIALTQYKQKVYGYTRSTFILHDSLFYMVKRVKGTIDGDVCELKDDEILSNNFTGRIDKGVKVTMTFRMNKQDTTWYLAGDWKTNKTKNYFSVSGKVELKEENNLDDSKIFPHLEELKLADDVAFYKEKKNPPVRQAEVVKAKPVIKEKITQAKDIPVKQKEVIPSGQPVVAKNDARPPQEIQKHADTTTENKTATILKTEAPKPEVVTPPIIKPAIPISSPATVVLPAAAAFVKERKTIAPQVVTFESDSLELSLYDNGEVDGDTVSVLLNGEVILAKQGLKTSAIKKTILIPTGSAELNLVLYAENLGKYPPNTGLLIVHDGEQVYQIRFSADLQQNAAIIFRRKVK